MLGEEGVETRTAKRVPNANGANTVRLPLFDLLQADESSGGQDGVDATSLLGGAKAEGRGGDTEDPEAKAKKNVGVIPVAVK